MVYQVALLNFEGPLDLLLQLIERSELSITEISLSSVTEQYLSYIDQLDDLNPLELNRFIDLASRLIYAKSRALLPVSPTEEDDDELEELSQQLERYSHYRKAAAFLEDILKQGRRSWERPVKPQPLPPDLSRLNIGLPDIQSAFEQALRNLPIPAEESVVEPLPSLEHINQQILLRIEAGPASLSQLFMDASSRPMLILVFVALLELVRSQMVSVSQTEAFGDIMVATL